MIKKVKFRASGTTCESCSTIIKKQAKKVNGVTGASFDYSTETGYIKYDADITTLKKIFSKIEEKGYPCREVLNVLNSRSSNQIEIKKSTLGIIFGLIGLLVMIFFLFRFVKGIELPQITQNMGYGLIFIVGLLTGFHCIAMCGGFVLSYTAKAAREKETPHKLHVMYAAGKTISYTIIGALFGLLGAIITFTPKLRGIAGILAGIFLLLFGLKMLNIFPSLRKLGFHTPSFVSKFVKKSSSKTKNPLIIGLLNGLMIACGPLQALYIMAAGTGSLIEGAKVLFIFGIGTLPVMIGFAYFTSFVSSKSTTKILKASSVIVILLGLIMINNGLILTGSGYDVKSMFTTVQTKNSITGNSITGNGVGELSNNVAVLKDGYQEIRMEVNRYGWKPNKFLLQKGVPVKWIIDGKEINGCNNAIQVPKYNLDFDIARGIQEIDFTPTKEGVIPWSCWMGMIPGTFIVTDNLEDGTNANAQKELNAVPTPRGGSCGASDRGCGCGGGV